MSSSIYCERSCEPDADRRWAIVGQAVLHEMVNRVADRGVQVHGGMGYMRTTPVEQFFRDARLYRIYEGTSEVQKLVIGRALVKKAQGRCASLQRRASLVANGTDVVLADRDVRGPRPSIVTAPAEGRSGRGEGARWTRGRAAP